MLRRYQTAFSDYLDKQLLLKHPPQELYEPISYIMELGGKRIRPVLSLLAAEAVSDSFEDALPTALAVEVFHNFSLVHDDIMDQASLRRGKTTIHKHWDVNTAILSGDVMLVWAYECLKDYPAQLFKDLTNLLSVTARQVCEGQQYDMNFPKQNKVSQEEYLHMIKYKTATLLGCALQMGAMVGGATKSESQPFYDFGIELGIAFQLQDDYLDTFGNSETFGKKIGGDIIENKKTMLFLLAIELSKPSERKVLEELFLTTPNDSEGKIAQVKTIFEDSGAVVELKKRIEKHTQKALQKIVLFPVTPAKKDTFRIFAKYLMERNL